jgi:hypothetical protein
MGERWVKVSKLLPSLCYAYIAWGSTNLLDTSGAVLQFDAEGYSFTSKRDVVGVTGALRFYANGGH